MAKLTGVTQMKLEFRRALVWHAGEQMHKLKTAMAGRLARRVNRDQPSAAPTTKLGT